MQLETKRLWIHNCGIERIRIDKLKLFKFIGSFLQFNYFALSEILAHKSDN